MKAKVFVLLSVLSLVFSAALSDNFLQKKSIRSEYAKRNESAAELAVEAQGKLGKVKHYALAKVLKKSLKLVDKIIRLKKGNDDNEWEEDSDCEDTPSDNEDEEPEYKKPEYKKPEYKKPKYKKPEYKEPKHNEPKYEEPNYEEPNYEEPKESESGWDSDNGHDSGSESDESDCESEDEEGSGKLGKLGKVKKIFKKVKGIFTKKTHLMKRSLVDDLLVKLFEALKKSGLVNDIVKMALTDDQVRPEIVRVTIDLLRADVIPWEEIFEALKESGLAVDVIENLLTDPETREGAVEFVVELVPALLKSGALDLEDIIKAIPGKDKDPKVNAALMEQVKKISA